MMEGVEMMDNYHQFINERKKPIGEKSTVRYKDTTRLDKAYEQSLLKPVHKEKIIEYTNELLDGIGMAKIEKSKIELPILDIDKIDYQNIKEVNNLEDIRDIVWMKFTTDGYLGVVAASNDINFQMPKCEKEYSQKNQSLKWIYNTSGILLHKLEKEWDTSFVLLFPLINIPKEYKRGDIERAIGNYLIDKHVPIIDFYSHRY